MPMLDGVRNKVKTGLATASILMSLAGGLLGSVSMLGDWLGAFADWFPWWMAPILAAATLMIFLGDWANGGSIRFSIYTGLMWPSFLVASLTGDTGAEFFRAVGAISKDTAADWKAGVTDWTNLPGSLENAFTVFSLFLIVGAITYSERYAKKDKGGSASPVGSGLPAATRRRG